MADATEVKRAMCFFSKPRCIVDDHLKDGRLEQLDPPPMRRCTGWKTAGEKGQGKWEEISWDQALNEIAPKLENIRDTHGAEGVGVTGGTSRARTPC